MHGSTATKHIIIGELPAGDYVLGDPKITVGNCASLQTFMDAYRASRLTGRRIFRSPPALRSTDRSALQPT